MPVSEKFQARIQRYHLTTTLSRDADILRRFFELKIAYTPVMPLAPEPAVRFALAPKVLEGLEALDELFYKDVEAYMKGAEVELVMPHSSPSKSLNKHLSAGFEALDREFYQIPEDNDTDLDTAYDGGSSHEDSDRESSVHGDDKPAREPMKVDPQTALISLMGFDLVEPAGPSEPKRPRRQESFKAFEIIKDLLVTKPKNKSKKN